MNSYATFHDLWIHTWIHVYSEIIPEIMCTQMVIYHISFCYKKHTLTDNVWKCYIASWGTSQDDRFWCLMVIIMYFPSPTRCNSSYSYSNTIALAYCQCKGAGLRSGCFGPIPHIIPVILQSESLTQASNLQSLALSQSPYGSEQGLCVSVQ